MLSNPWRQICALRIKAKDGKLFVGTGWFIGPKTLLTAGHCVFMQNEGGWAASIEIIPAKHGDTEPFGRVTATRFASVDGWVEQASRDFDYGVILLENDALGRRLGNFAVNALDQPELTAAVAKISGYPADLDRAQFQYFHERQLMSVTESRLNYDID